MADEQEDEVLYYLEDIMVSSSCSGYKSAGEVVDVVDVSDSLAWLHAMHKIGARADYERLYPPKEEVVVEPVVESTVVETTEPTVPTEVSADAAALIDKAKEVLAKGKKRIAELAVECESTEAVLEPLLTKENGFFRNQQAWYSVPVVQG